MSKATINSAELLVRLRFLVDSLSHINQLSYQKALPHVNTEDLNQIAKIGGIIDFHTQEILDRQKKRMENE
jgi:hypothetical protein|tara:strand:+ start:1591 stop:1803 length:213 start_codon:yes stop_codon:yes gene_type:complete